MKSKIFKYLYGLLVLVPALAVFSTCAYVSLNENAKDSYSDYTYTTEETIKVTSFNDLVPYTNAFLVLNADDSYSSLTSSSYKTHFLNFTINNTTYNEGIFTLGASIGQVNGYWIVFYDTNMNYINRYSINSYAGTYQFYLVESYTDNAYYYPNNMYSNYFYYIGLTQNNGTIDDAFYHSMEVVENSQLFSWVKGNFLYDGMNNFADIFNAKDTFLSFYFAYVLTMSLIYLAFEVLMLFINMARNLINAIQRKEW